MIVFIYIGWILRLSLQYKIRANQDMATAFYDFQEEFVKHFHDKFHKRDKTLSLGRIKEMIQKKWASYDIEKLRDFFIVYCLNLNVDHIDKEDLGYKDWFSETMCLKFQGEDEKCVRFCKDKHKEFKNRTAPTVLSFRMEYETEAEQEEEPGYRTPQKQSVEDKEKHLLSTAARDDDEIKYQSPKKQKRPFNKTSYFNDTFQDVVDSLELSRSVGMRREKIISKRRKSRR